MLAATAVSLVFLIPSASAGSDSATAGAGTDDITVEFVPDNMIFKAPTNQRGAWEGATPAVGPRPGDESRWVAGTMYYSIRGDYQLDEVLDIVNGLACDLSGGQLCR